MPAAMHARRAGSPCPARLASYDPVPDLPGNIGLGAERQSMALARGREQHAGIGAHGKAGLTFCAQPRHLVGKEIVEALGLELAGAMFFDIVGLGGKAEEPLACRG